MEKITTNRLLKILISMLVVFTIKGWVLKIVNWYGAYRLLDHFFNEETKENNKKFELKQPNDLTI